MSQKFKSGSVTPITDSLIKKWPLPAIDESTDKDGRGKVFIVAGSPEMPGAIILTATCAMRAGAGKIQIAAPAPVATSTAIALPETFVMSCAVGHDGGFLFSSASTLIKNIEKSDTVLLGPGMVEGSKLNSFIKKLLKSLSNQTVIFDAAALTVFTKDPSWNTKASIKVILTPHEGEMATLTGHTKDYVKNNAKTLALDYAKKSGAVVILKGPQTYIASPDGELFLNTRGNKGLAASGSGDSLAGIISGLSARGATALQAAVWGVYLHALAGERLSKKHGEIGYLVREIAQEVPSLISKFSK